MTQTNHIDVVRSEDALVSAAYETYATGACLHRYAHRNYRFHMKHDGPDSPLTRAALADAAQALMLLSDAAARYRKAKATALVGAR